MRISIYLILCNEYFVYFILRKELDAFLHAFLLSDFKCQLIYNVQDSLILPFASTHFIKL